MAVSYYLKFALLAVGILATFVFITLIPLGKRDQVSWTETSIYYFSPQTDSSCYTTARHRQLLQNGL